MYRNIIMIFVFNFIIEMSLLFLHVGGKKVVIFRMRFLNLVHCDAPNTKI